MQVEDLKRKQICELARKDKEIKQLQEDKFHLESGMTLKRANIYAKQNYGLTIDEMNTKLEVNN